MKKMISIITDTSNILIGILMACLMMAFGKHWFIFALFLFMNIVETVTGWMKDKVQGKEKPTFGAKGCVRKLGYWIMIAFAFMLSLGFVELGKVLEVDLGLSPLLGWFVVASLCLNETRSILENFVEAGYDVPAVLIKALEILGKFVNKDAKKLPEDCDCEEVNKELKEVNKELEVVSKELEEVNKELEEVKSDVQVETTLAEPTEAGGEE